MTIEDVFVEVRKELLESRNWVYVSSEVPVSFPPTTKQSPTSTTMIIAVTIIIILLLDFSSFTISPLLLTL